MHHLTIRLGISADEYLKHYQGSAKSVFCTSLDGRSVRFPAGILQKFVMRDGVYGTFRLHFDEQNRYQRIEKID